ncbi:MAG: pantetheine-phosphate adenylyltransferase [Candidatus Delongbacteria bacterium]|nr:pantetheine-phosphate adenylyltransferase [Candidatus Delongbacteria bacterium]
MKSCVYPGTFDPITNGHLDLVKRALEIFDIVHIAISINPTKVPLFTCEERLTIIREIVSGNPRVQVHTNAGLIVNFVKQIEAQAIIRGLRALSDFEYEFQMALMNRQMMPEVETVFLMPRAEYIYLNSTLVKQLARFNAPLKGLVPLYVETQLRLKFTPTPPSEAF